MALSPDAQKWYEIGLEQGKNDLGVESVLSKKTRAELTELLQDAPRDHKYAFKAGAIAGLKAAYEQQPGFDAAREAAAINEANVKHAGLLQLAESYTPAPIPPPTAPPVQRPSQQSAPTPARSPQPTAQPHGAPTSASETHTSQQQLAHTPQSNIQQTPSGGTAANAAERPHTNAAGHSTTPVAAQVPATPSHTPAPRKKLLRSFYDFWFKPIPPGHGPGFPKWFPAIVQKSWDFWFKPKGGGHSEGHGHH